MRVVNWGKYPNFKKTEFDCSHTGANEMQDEFMNLLQQLRTQYGKPLKITSGYRDKTHPVEAKKTVRGAHNYGMAVDIAIDRAEAYKVLGIAIKLGFTGIGIKQHGEGRFIHLDTIPNNSEQPRPTIWGYP
jgi:uncharacterized protein YcbK (DUF882 family)